MVGCIDLEVMSTSLDNSQMYNITLLMLHGLDSLLQIHANTARTADSTWNTFMHSCNFPVYMKDIPLKRPPDTESIRARSFSRSVYMSGLHTIWKNFLMKKNIEICQDLRLSYALTRTFFCVTKKPWRVSVFSYRPFYSPSKSRSLPPGLPIAQPWLMSRFASIWIWYVSVLEGSEPSDAEPLLFLNSSNDLEIFRYCISRCLMIQILNTVQGTRALQGFDFGTSD